jgi:hypothetical protein
MVIAQSDRRFRKSLQPAEIIGGPVGLGLLPCNAARPWFMFRDPLFLSVGLSCTSLGYLQDGSDRDLVIPQHRVPETSVRMRPSLP